MVRLCSSCDCLKKNVSENIDSLETAQKKKKEERRRKYWKNAHLDMYIYLWVSEWEREKRRDRYVSLYILGLSS